MGTKAMVSAKTGKAVTVISPRKKKANRMTIPALVALPLAFTVVESTKRLTTGYGKSEAGVGGMLNYLTAAYTGYIPRDQSFDLKMLKQGAIPLLVGVLGHKVANRVGINRMLSGAGIPFLRL